MRETVSLKTTYDQFRISVRRDTRSKLFDPRTREKLFKEFLKTLRAERDQREQGFIAMLRELRDVHSDTRYRDVSFVDSQFTYIRFKRRFHRICGTRRSSRRREGKNCITNIATSYGTRSQKSRISSNGMH
jgi:hypothetical protein